MPKPTHDLDDRTRPPPRSTAAERCIDVLQALIVYFTIFIVGFLIINGLGEMITRLLATAP
jgi:hypothetical protein